MIFLYILLLSLVLFSFFVISSKNAIHSLLALISVFILSSILLIVLNVEFLAFAFVIVYAGAIAILFLFVIMMIDLKVIDRSLDILSYGPLGYFMGFVFLLEISLPLAKTNCFSVEMFVSQLSWMNWFLLMDALPHIQALGQLLYTYYFMFFLIAGFILFIAIIGAIALTYEKPSNISTKELTVHLS